MTKQEEWLKLQKKEDPVKKEKVVELPPIDDDDLNANWLHNENWKKKNDRDRKNDL